MKLIVLKADRAGALEQEAMPNESPKLTYTFHGAELTTTYRTTWATQATYARFLLPQMTFGLSTADRALAASFTVSYSMPHAWAPGNDENLNLRCYAVDVEPEVGKSFARPRASGGIGWEIALLHARYRVENTNVLLTIIQETLEPTIEFSSMSNRGLFWDAGASTNPLKPDEAPPRLSQMMRWSYTIKGLPGLPGDIFSTYQGHINTSAMTSPTYGVTFPAGTVFFLAPHIVPSTGMFGTNLFDITYEFLVKTEDAVEQTWNKGYKAATSGLQPIYNAAGVLVNITAVNLNDLLITTVT